MQTSFKESNIFFDRILQIIDYKDIKSVNDFALNWLNYDAPQKINRLKDKKNKPSYEIILDIVNKFTEINPEWLITGKGPMLKEIEPVEVISEPIITNRKTKDKIHELQRVPLFNLEATMGLVPVVNNNGLDEEKIIDYISIPAMAICDGAIYASGDSMYPLLKAGDMVAYKKIDIDLDNIFFGEIYILALYIDESTTMKTIKFVQKSDKGDDYIKLVSQNPHHADKDVKITQIAAMGLVRASIRLHN